MTDQELLDDSKYEKLENHSDNPPQGTEGGVVLLKTFNTEEEAQVCTATLKSEGIDAHVITSATSGMTPFAYGNIRLYVAESQEDEALLIVQRLNAEKEVYDNPRLSAERIFAIVAVGLLAIGIIIYFLQQAIYGF